MRAIGLGLAGPFVAHIAAAEPADAKAVRAYITESERAWAASAVTGDAKPLARFLAPDFVGVSTTGAFYKRDKAMAEAAEGPKSFAANRLVGVDIVFYGDMTAVARGSESWTRKDGRKGRFVWTDTWIKRDGAWKIVAAVDVEAPEK